MRCPVEGDPVTIHPMVHVVKGNVAASVISYRDKSVLILSQGVKSYDRS